MFLQVMGARYKAVDSKAPTWLTLYDVETTGVITSKEYEALESLGSDLDKVTMSDLGGNSSRTYAHLRTTVHPGTTAEELPGKYVFAVSIEVAPENEDDFIKWYACFSDCDFSWFDFLSKNDEEHVDLISRVPGWKRCRRYKLVASQPVSKHLALHELDNKDFSTTAETKYATTTEWSQRVLKNMVRVEARPSPNRSRADGREDNVLTGNLVDL
jgi:hypothetical protein